MKASRASIAQVITDRSMKGLSKPDALALASYLLRSGRTAELASILRDVQAGWARNGYVEVIATSAHELSPEVRTDIETEAKRLYPDAKRVVITESLQPEVVGGVQLTIVDHQLDLTIRGKLQKFKMFAVHGKEN